MYLQHCHYSQISAFFMSPSLFLQPSFLQTFCIMLLLVLPSGVLWSQNAWFWSTILSLKAHASHLLCLASLCRNMYIASSFDPIPLLILRGFNYDTWRRKIYSFLYRHSSYFSPCHCIHNVNLSPHDALYQAFISLITSSPFNYLYH